MRVAVIGGGSWGTTVAHLAAHNAPTVMYCRDQEVADGITTKHRNERYLPDYELHPELTASTDLAQVAGACDVLVMGVPSHSFREVMETTASVLRPWVPVLSLTKGLEKGTKLRMSQVAGDVLPGHPVGVLTGPNLAKEIMASGPALSVVAMTDLVIAERLQPLFVTPTFRVYTNHDVVGAEIGGALKNVVALAAGMVAGLGLGDNTRAAIITRGLAEITRLGVALGGEEATLAGLTGLGDLLATCISTQSRNRFVGEQLGAGRSLTEIIDEMNQVAEGVKSAPVVLELAAEHNIEMPIAETVNRVIAGELTAAEAMVDLMGRRTGHESNPAAQV